MSPNGRRLAEVAQEPPPQNERTSSRSVHGSKDAQGPACGTERTARSIVGMTMGARKRAAWNLAAANHRHRDYNDPNQLFNAEVDAEQERQWATNLKAAHAKYRIGERLRPCPGCHTCMPGVKGWHIDRVRGRFKMPTIAWSCDGSGVLPARAKKARR